MIVATRLRKGSANSARGAARLVADALKTSRACGASGLLVVRADSAFYGRDVVAAIAPGEGPVLHHRPPGRRRDAGRSPAIAEDAWTTIRYPHAVFDDQLQQWVSDAEVAEIAVHRVRLHAAEARRHRPVDRAPSPRPEPRPPRAPTRRASCSRPGATTPCSPTRRC